MLEVPFSLTLTPIIVSPVSSTTRPFMIFASGCAGAASEFAFSIRLVVADT